MLVLSRKVGERVIVDGDVVIEILEVKGRRIRLGIEAPAHAAVLRDELSAAGEPAPPAPVRKPR
jgi:carbon storage regulator